MQLPRACSSNCLIRECAAHDREAGAGKIRDIIVVQLNNDYISDFTGTGLTIVGGTLTNKAVGAAGAWQLHSSIANTLTPTSSVAGIFVNASSTFDSWLRASDHLAVGGAFQNGYGLTV